MSKRTKKNDDIANIEPLIKVEADRNAHRCDTLLEALQDVLEASKDSQFCKHLYRNEEWANHAFDYLNNRLALTDEQIILLAVILEEGMDGSVSIRDISEHIKCSRIEVLQHSSELDILIEKGFIYSDGRNNYCVEDDALKVIRKNEVYENKSELFETDDDLFLELNRLHTMASDHMITSYELNRKVKSIIEHNYELSIARAYTRYMNQLDDAEFRFLVAASLCWLVFDDTITMNSCRFVFDNTRMGRLLGNNLCKGTSKLNTLGLVECVNNSGIAMRNEYCLTEKAKHSISEEWARVKNEALDCANLIQATKIASKKLFYNKKEDREIRELQSLMYESNLKNVMRRLKARNLRCGFTCLFYGAPGTGKTETVYQLAKNTGRDIFVVDASQLRSKWVGESEKNIKAIFDDYRILCEKQKKKAILFLNEADSIICKRMEGAERSVDKSENTIQNIILQEMESLDGILIATTNLANNMDSAFERRFLYKVEFEKPDTEVRAKIWKSMLPSLNKDDATVLSERFPKFAGGQIENITRKVTVNEVLRGEVTKLEDIVSLCEHETIGSENSNKKAIGFQRR